MEQVWDCGKATTAVDPAGFAVRIERGDSFSNCISCNFHGKQSYLLQELKRLQKRPPLVSGRSSAPPSI
jgi:hypothetical protein